MTRRFTSIMLVTGIVAATLVVTPTAAYAEEDKCPGVQKPVAASKVKDSALWPQEMLNAKRVWSKAKGAGITVGVIDSGVQSDNDLLKGRVDGGTAYVAEDENKKPSGGDDATTDCDGHGTEVASVIAAEEDKKSGFYGLAPEARIKPYRIAYQRSEGGEQPNEDDEDDSSEKPVVTSEKFAAAIKKAADDDCDVINLSVKFAHYDVIEEAINHALGEGVVIVAAAGNDGTKAEGPAYPASYPGVIGVGAVDQRISKTAASESGPWVDIVAPGEQNIAAPLPDGRYETQFGGTSAATAYVSGTVALIRSHHKGWDSSKVIKQLLGTAGPTPGGTGHVGDKTTEGVTGVSPDYGFGMVDPYAAITETVKSSGSDSQAAMDDPKVADSVREKNADFEKMRGWGLWITLGGLALFILALAGVAALRRGKKSTWSVKRVNRRSQIEHFDDGDPIPLFQGIKGLKE